jgi:hypothetical protein
MSMTFMHERVEKFIIWLPVEEQEVRREGIDQELMPYLQDAIIRMPKLTHLDLQMNIPSRLITTQITTFLSSICSLQTIILPCYHLTSPVLNALSHLPNLRTIGCDVDKEGGCIADVKAVSLTSSEAVFPALRDLSLTATLGDMVRLLEMDFAPLGNLSGLSLECACLQSAEEVYDFLRCISERCQTLKELNLDMNWIDSSDNHPVREDLITFETLQPLIACSNLT